jgi:phage tail sheath gpL-like
VASIILVGLGAQYAVPGVFVELDFAQGPVAGFGGARKILLLGNKTSAGTATVDTVVYGPDTQNPCQVEADVIGLFGTGSQLHRMYLRFTAINTISSLYFLAVTASAGVSATINETLVTNATSAGNHRFWCVDQYVDTTINSGDTITTIAANIALSINQQTRWPVTATSSVGVVTITAKIPGPEGNWIRVQALITPTTATIGTTTSLTANTFLSTGATADVNTTALTTIASARYYYIVPGDSDSTNLGRLVTQVNSQALPLNGMRQRVVFGSMDTLANTTTVCTGLNAARAECVWGNSTDFTPSELAANNAAIYSLLEQGSPFGVARKNYSNFPANSTDSTIWLVAAGRNGVGGSPTPTQQNSALQSGISPIAVQPGGGAYLVKRCTTRSLNGAILDFRIRDAHKVSVCDYWCDDAATITALQFGGKDLLPDPVQGQPPPPPTATTPKRWAGAIKSLTNNYGSAGQWSFPPGETPQPGESPADTINRLTIVQAETNPPTRMSALVGLSPVNILDQLAVLAQQVG